MRKLPLRYYQLLVLAMVPIALQVSLPWMFDLQSDPDELKNVFRDPAHRQTVRELSGALLAYAQKNADPYVDNPKVRADLRWAVAGAGQYISNLPANPPRKVVAKKRATQKKAGKSQNKQQEKNE